MEAGTAATAAVLAAAAAAPAHNFADWQQHQQQQEEADLFAWVFQPAEQHHPLALQQPVLPIEAAADAEGGVPAAAAGAAEFPAIWQLQQGEHAADLYAWLLQPAQQPCLVQQPVLPYEATAELDAMAAAMEPTAAAAEHPGTLQEQQVGDLQARLLRPAQEPDLAQQARAPAEAVALDVSVGPVHSSDDNDSGFHSLLELLLCPSLDIEGVTSFKTEAAAGAQPASSVDTTATSPTPAAAPLPVQLHAFVPVEPQHSLLANPSAAAAPSATTTCFPWVLRPQPLLVLPSTRPQHPSWVFPHATSCCFLLEGVCVSCLSCITRSWCPCLAFTVPLWGTCCCRGCLLHTKPSTTLASPSSCSRLSCSC